MLTANSQAKIIIITGRAEKEHALKAVADGAYDILYKPVDIEELKVLLKRAFYLTSLEKENQAMQRKLGDSAFEGMIGSSVQMEELFSTVRKVASSDVPVLITGESGTGKELVAKAIHSLSNRKDGPFAVINCGAIPENLLESELFGHEKGSFTGAHVQRKGRVELANGGTLFLDEIGELPLALQVKMLRFLQEQVIERVGGREQIGVDVRVVAATNRDLKEAMKNGAFREDLYFRLGVVTIFLPPLREREGEILVLSNAFLNRYAEESKRKLSGFTQAAINALERYEWPGNVRELENKIKRAVVMADGTKVRAEDLEMVKGERREDLTLKDAREAVEREMVLKALTRHQQNMTRAAEELGISRPTLYELMDKLGIEKSRV
jgi:two-component system NtrC family response regulator